MNRVPTSPSLRRPCAAVLAGIAVALVTPPSRAVPVFTGADGGISFGVSPYANVVPGVPTYIPNNFSGLNDILSSPGGSFLTANPVVANNIQEIGPGAWGPGQFQFGFQTGGGNGFGDFGSGSVVNTGTQVAFSLVDPIAGSGSASYEIVSWDATFNNAAAYGGAFGTYLSVAGQIFDLNAAAAVALRTHITSANPLSPFFGGIDLPQLVLAAAHTPSGPSFVALGGPGGGNAVMLIAPNWTFQGLAIDNLAFAIPAGDVFTATSTLTVFADPSMMSSIIPTPDLISLTGTTLPDFGLVSVVPEPGSLSLLSLGGLVLVAGLCRRSAATIATGD